MQAIVLAGGFGTRLKQVVNQVPKPLAAIAGKPFLYWLILYLQKQGVNNIIFSLGYMHEQIESFLQQNFSTLNYTCVIEKEPLGTGGAIKYCLQQTNTTYNTVVLFNGDTFFNLNLTQFIQAYTQNNAQCSIALTPMHNFDRYGSVLLDDNNRILQFNEKKHCQQGLINTGIIAFDKNIFLNKTQHLPVQFSFEKDFLEPNMQSLLVTGYTDDNYFIDIGIPEDYYKANNELHLIV